MDYYYFEEWGRYNLLCQNSIMMAIQRLVIKITQSCSVLEVHSHSNPVHVCMCWHWYLITHAHNTHSPNTHCKERAVSLLFITTTSLLQASPMGWLPSVGIHSCRTLSLPTQAFHTGSLSLHLNSVVSHFIHLMLLTLSSKSDYVCRVWL